MIIELLISLTLSIELKQSEMQEAHPNSTAAVAAEASSLSSISAEKARLQLPLPHKVDAPNDPDSTISEPPGINDDWAVTIGIPARQKYMEAIEHEVGCPYHLYASYLLTCRPEKRKSAWRRIVQENWLMFDKNRVGKFEAISRKYELL